MGDDSHFDASGGAPDDAPDDYVGAKLALFLGASLLVIRRDEGIAIPWPGFLDFPGGGREGDERPAACALRETREEVGLQVAEADLIWRRRYVRPGGPVWFFAARLPKARVAEVVLGDEGQGWMLMAPDAYLEHPAGIPHFKDRLRDFLGEGHEGREA